MELDEDNGQGTMSQPFLIQCIQDLLGDAANDVNTKDTPAVYKDFFN